MDKIAVSLYGGKGLFSKKENPLRAEEVYCDKYEKCSLYKNGCCLNITSPFSVKCMFGKVNKIQGYTSRAMKYGQFKNKYTCDEKYDKLSHPSNCRIALIDDYVYLNVTFSRVKQENNDYYVTEKGFCSGDSWIELDKFNCELLDKICNYRARAMMGGEITEYRKKCIPDMLQQLKKMLPKLYDEFIKENPKFDLEPNYIGKYAYIKTLVKGSTLIDYKDNEFEFDGEYLTCKQWESSFVPFNTGVAEIKIKVTDKMTYKINNNSQVDENTVFEQ